MARIVANDKDDAAAAHNLTGIANTLHTGTNFHDTTIPISTSAEKWKKASIALWRIDWQAPADKRFFTPWQARFSTPFLQSPITKYLGKRAEYGKWAACPRGFT
jgi:hypothetical protein